MEKLLYSKVFKPQRVLGISCEIGNDGRFLWRYCLLKQNRKNIQLLKTGSTYDISELQKEKISLVPAYLTIEGKGVLHKQIKINDDPYSVLQMIPNASPDDFCITEFSISDDTGFASIVRSEVVESVLEQCGLNGISVIDVKAGSFHVNKLYQWFDNLPEVLVTANMEYLFDYSKPGELEYKKTDISSDLCYQIAGETIPSVFLSPFVSALNFYIGTEETAYPPVKKNKIDFFAHRFFILGGWSTLIIAFLVLLINSLVFMHYTDMENQLEKQVSNNNQYLIILNKLKEELKQKDQFLLQSGFTEKTRFSFFTDRIASSVPSGIHLSGLSVSPLQSKIKKEKAIEFRKGYISLNGQTPNSIILNDWITVLEKYPWIGKISVIHYLQEQSDNFGEFQIEIELKNNHSSHEQMEL